jgi:hypothetical protein
MEIQVNDRKITLKKTFRSYIIFESATGKPFAPKTLTDTIMYFYCVVIASDSEIELSFDEFVDWLDNAPTALQEFTEWLIRQSEVDSATSKKKSVRKAKNK